MDGRRRYCYRTVYIQHLGILVSYPPWLPLGELSLSVLAEIQDCLHLTPRNPSYPPLQARWRAVLPHRLLVSRTS